MTHVSSVKGPLKPTAAGQGLAAAAAAAAGSPAGLTPSQSYSRESSTSSSATMQAQARGEAADAVGSPGHTPFHSRQQSFPHKDSAAVPMQSNSFSFQDTTAAPAPPAAPSTDNVSGGGSDWGLALARLRFLKDLRFALNEILTHEDLYLTADLLASTSNDPNITMGGGGGKVIGYG